MNYDLHTSLPSPYAIPTHPYTQLANKNPIYTLRAPIVIHTTPTAPPPRNNRTKKKKEPQPYIYLGIPFTYAAINQCLISAHWRSIWRCVKGFPAHVRPLSLSRRTLCKRLRIWLFSCPRRAATTPSRIHYTFTILSLHSRACVRVCPRDAPPSREREREREKSRPAFVYTWHLQRGPFCPRENFCLRNCADIYKSVLRARGRFNFTEGKGEREKIRYFHQKLPFFQALPWSNYREPVHAKRVVPRSALLRRLLCFLLCLVYVGVGIYRIALGLRRKM